MTQAQKTLEYTERQNLRLRELLLKEEEENRLARIALEGKNETILNMKAEILVLNNRLKDFGSIDAKTAEIVQMKKQQDELLNALQK